MPAPLLLSLGYAATAASVLLGWMNLGQTALTLLLETALALHYAGRRTVLAEGVVAAVDPGYAPSSGLRPVAGQPLHPDDRALLAHHEGRWLQGLLLAVGAVVLLVARGDLATSWAGIGAWLVVTVGLALGERQRFRAWQESGAPRTADPLTQRSHVAGRVLVLCGLVLMIGSWLGAGHTVGALVLLGAMWLVDLYHELPAGRPDLRDALEAEDDPA